MATLLQEVTAQIGCCQAEMCADAWRKVMEAQSRGTNVRAIAYSMRGYGDSSRVSTEQSSGSAPLTQLAKQHSADFGAFLEYLVANRNVSGKITLLAWSMGNAYLLAVYYFAQKSMSPRQYKLLTSGQIHRVVHFEIGSGRMGYPNGPSLKSMFADQIESKGYKRAFLEFTGGYYRHSEQFKAEHGQDLTSWTNYPFKTLTDDADFLSWAESCFDIRDSKGANHWSLLDDRSDSTRIQSAFGEAISRLCTSGVQRVTVLYGEWCAAEFMYGCWIVEHLAKTHANISVDEICVPEGNHFIQYQFPDSFWAIINRHNM